MCSAPVQVKLHVSFAQIISSGESSGWHPTGYIIGRSASKVTPLPSFLRTEVIVSQINNPIG
jgi:hypothetical protein